MIGASKCGTTSLHRYLSLHPQIASASIKETQYFVPLIYGEPLASLEDYAQFFKDTGEAKYRIESTAGYLHGGAPLAEAMHAALGRPRLLLILRDPVARVWSYYRYMKAQQAIPATMELDEYLERCRAVEPRLPRTRSEDIFAALYGGVYADYIEAWRPYAETRLYVLFLEHLQADPARSLSELAAWLGVDSFAWESATLGVSNPSVMYRNAWVQRVAIEANRVGERVWDRLPALKSWVRRAYYRLNGAEWEEAMSEEQRAWLQDFYTPHNHRLAALLEARTPRPRLPSWLTQER
ncbi:MAG: sulfotransferase [Bacteroidota bacterium]